MRTGSSVELDRLPWRVRHDWGRRVASRGRRLLVQATHRHATVRFQGPAYLGPGFRLDIPGSGTLLVGPRVHFRRGFTCEIGAGGRVTIGADTAFTYDTVIQCSTTIDIGERCLIGRVLIVDGNHRFRDPDRPIMAQGYDHVPITIGDDCWIAHNAVVIASVGRHSVVGANAVVTRPVPDCSVAVGSPARVVESFGGDVGDLGVAGRGEGPGR